MAGVTRDATSSIYYPATSGEMATTLAVAGIGNGNPLALWNLQEASGDAADSAGTITLTASGTLAYQQSVSGLSRKGIATTTGVAGALKNTTVSLPDIGFISALLVVDVAVPTSVSTTRTVAQLGAAFGSAASAQYITATNKKLNAAIDPNTAAGADDATTAVRSLVLQVDRTHGAAALYSPAEALAPALTSTPTGRTAMLGGDNVISFFPDAFTFVWGALFIGQAAEWTQAQARSFFQTRGYAVAW